MRADGHDPVPRLDEPQQRCGNGGPEDLRFRLDEGLDFTAVKSAAVHVRDRLVDIALVDFAMLSGGNGVHVVVPLRRRHDWAAHKDFARRFVEALSVAEPNRFTATTSKAKRKGGHLYRLATQPTRQHGRPALFGPHAAEPPWPFRSPGTDLAKSTMRIHSRSRLRRN